MAAEEGAARALVLPLALIIDIGLQALVEVDLVGRIQVEQCSRGNRHHKRLGVGVHDRFVNARWPTP